MNKDRNQLDDWMYLTSMVINSIKVISLFSPWNKDKNMSEFSLMSFSSCNINFCAGLAVQNFRRNLGSWMHALSPNWCLKHCPGLKGLLHCELFSPFPPFSTFFFFFNILENCAVFSVECRRLPQKPWEMGTWCMHLIITTVKKKLISLLGVICISVIVLLVLGWVWKRGTIWKPLIKNSFSLSLLWLC